MSVVSPNNVPADSANRAHLFQEVLLALDSGDLIDASDTISKWLVDDPLDARALTAQARLFRMTGCVPPAQVALDQALTEMPGFAPALLEAARCASSVGKPEDAHALYDSAYRAEGNSAPWLSEWCDLLHGMGRTDLGQAVAQHWCEQCPDLSAAWFQLGLFRQMAKLPEAALEAYARASALEPDHAMLNNNLSALHYELCNFDIALHFGLRAVRLKPDSHLAWTNLANIWLALREPDKAVLTARRACVLAPDYLLALLALSNALRETQQWTEAYDTIVRAAKLPGWDAAIQWSVAMLQLLRGDFENGWINFEARWTGSPELKKFTDFHPDRRWRNEDLAGRTLLIWGEQGFGDVLQFIRFVPLMAKKVQEAGGRLTLCCFSELLPLLRRSLANCNVKIVSNDAVDPPRFNHHIPLASLPLALDITQDKLVTSPVYLYPKASRMTHWQRRLPNTRRLRVGLTWTGSRTHQRNPLRAISIDTYAQAFAGLPGVDFYSLQLGADDDVEHMTSAGMEIIDHTAELSSFDETAALIAHLDLVITVCTSVAHLAAALGKPTWVLLDVNPHWTWMLERSDSPWYPSVSLYRQRIYRDWSEPLQRVRADLLKWIEARE